MVKVYLVYYQNITAVLLTFLSGLQTIALSGRAYIYTIRGMEWNPSPETRCKYIRVRSDAASMRHTVSDNGFHSISLTVDGTAMSKYKKLPGI